MTAFATLLLALTLAAKPAARPTTTAEQDDAACAMDLYTAGAAATIRDYARAEELQQGVVTRCGGPTAPKDLRAGLLETLADYQLRQRRWQPGLASAERCLELDPAAPTCHFFRWFALRQLGRQDDAAAERPIAQAAFDAYLARKPAPNASKKEQQRLAKDQDAARQLLAVMTSAK